MAETSAALTLDLVRAALRDGPLALDALCARLELDPARAEARGLWDLVADPHIVTLADRRLADGVALGRGRTALHRLDQAEIDDRVVRFDEDVAGPVATASDPSRVTAGDVEVALRPGLEEDGEDDPGADPLVDLPPGWGTDLAEGDLVGVTVAEDGGLILTIHDLDAAPPATDGGAAAVVGALTTMGATVGTPLVGEDDPWVLDLVDGLVQLYADHPEATEALRRPLTEVLDDAGMAYGGGFLASPGIEEHRLRLFQIGADVLGGPWADPEALDQAEALGTVWLLLLGVGEETIRDPDRAAVVAAILTDPEAPIALARYLRAAGVEVEAGPLDRLVAAADVDPGDPGPAQLLAEASVMAGRAPEVLDRLSAAVVEVDEDEWAEALELLGHLRAVAGDLDCAARALTRIGLHDTVTFLGRWRGTAPAGVGRNDPCPCGSGRKHKQCCLGRPIRISLDDRGELLWWKARTWCLRTQGLVLPWSAVLDEADDGGADALVLDLALVADDALAVFTVELGSLLPGDEAALVESWLERPYRLWEVGEARDEDGTSLTDLTGPADRSAVTTVSPPASALSPGETVLALVVPGGDGRDRVVGQVVRVPPSARDDTLGLLADHASAQVLLDWVLELGPGALVRPTPSRG